MAATDLGFIGDSNYVAMALGCGPDLYFHIFSTSYNMLLLHDSNLTKETLLNQIFRIIASNGVNN